MQVNKQPRQTVVDITNNHFKKNCLQRAIYNYCAIPTKKNKLPRQQKVKTEHAPHKNNRSQSFEIKSLTLDSYRLITVSRGLVSWNLLFHFQMFSLSALFFTTIQVFKKHQKHPPPPSLIAATIFLNFQGAQESIPN